jgi:SAM-dependent methyltransferase
MTNRPVPDEQTLHAAAKRRLRRRESGSGQMTIPAIPSLSEHYFAKAMTLFELLGRPFNEADAATFREILERLTKDAWKRAPGASLLLRYESQPGAEAGINYDFKIVTMTLAANYDGWVDSRPRPFFGAKANPKVLEVARSLGPPGDVTVLDIGAAEGRNTLPLAREGFAVDAVELSPKFARLLRDALAAENHLSYVYEGDFLDPSLEMPLERYRLVVFAGVLVAHVRNLVHLRGMLARACTLLAPGGMLLFNLFLTQDGYVPDVVVRELGELFWTVPFTPAELSEATRGLPVRLVEDIPFVEYERTHAPESWPPTDYFEAYCEAQDLFDLPAGEAPLSLRWLTFRKV